MNPIPAGEATHQPPLRDTHDLEPEERPLPQTDLDIDEQWRRAAAWEGDELRPVVGPGEGISQPGSTFDPDEECGDISIPPGTPITDAARALVKGRYTRHWDSDEQREEFWRRMREIGKDLPDPDELDRMAGDPCAS